MTENTWKFDEWIRTQFVEHNNELECLYWQPADKANVEGIGEEIKKSLVEQGNYYISKLLQEGNTDEV